MICDQRLEVDAQVTIATRDGVLRESFATPVRLQEDGALRLHAVRELQMLRGRFRVTEVRRDDLIADHLDFELRFSPDGSVRGYVGGEYEVAESDTSRWTTLVRFACLPEQACR